MSDVKKTLFEAAYEAEVGTQWVLTKSASKLKCHKEADGDVVWSENGDGYIENEGDSVPFHVALRTDFEQLPSGPKKRDVRQGQVVGEDSVYIPSDKMQECIDAFKLIGRLTQWEGAQIGKPGYVIITTSRKAVYSEIQTPCDVTFQTAEQCEAAWKAECPEMFNGNI